MKQHTDEEIISRFKEMYKDRDLYDHIYMSSSFLIKVIKNTPEEIQITVRDMYEDNIMRPSFAALCAIKDFFNTTDIGFDTEAWEGCESCGYGGKKQIDFVIKPNKKGGK